MAKQTKKLVDEARALGIDVDGRWGDETIQERIDEAKAAQAAKIAEGQGDEEGDGEGAAEADGVDQVERGVSSGDSGGPKSAGDAAAASSQDPTAGSVDGDGASAGSDVAGDVAASVPPQAPDGNGGDAPSDPAGVADGNDDPGETVGGGDDQGGASAAGVAEGADDGGDRHSGGDGDGDRAGQPEGAAGAAGGDPGDAEGDPVGDQVDHGDGSADGEAYQHDNALDEKDSPELDVAYQALTAPMLAAYQAAGVAFGALRAGDNGRWQGAFDADWFSQDVMSLHPIALVAHAVPFVRTWPDAPVAAVYGHVSSGGGVNLAIERPWPELPLAERIAWMVFRDTLLTIDRMTAAEPAPAAEAQDVHRVPLDETTMERVDDPLQLTELAGGPR